MSLLGIQLSRGKGNQKNYFKIINKSRTQSCILRDPRKMIEPSGQELWVSVEDLQSLWNHCVSIISMQTLLKMSVNWIVIITSVCYFAFYAVEITIYWSQLL